MPSSTLDHVLNILSTAVMYGCIALAPEIKRKFKTFIKKRTDYFSHNIGIRKRIDDILFEIRLRMNANRAIIIEFSNTEKTINYFPFEFMNQTFEKTDGNVVSIKDQWQKKNVNAYVEFLDVLRHEHVQHYIFSPQNEAHPETGIHLEVMHIKTCIIFKLSKQLNTGFIGLHYTSDTYDGNWDNAHPDKQFLRVKAAEILQLMKSLK